MNILVVELVLNFLESERFDFFGDLFDAFEEAAVVGHDAVLGVEVEQVHFILHDGRVVGFQELLGDSLKVAHF